MARIKPILVTGSFALTFVAGIAFAQGFTPRIDPELIAARQSLNAAMTHLQNTTDPEVIQIVRARAYIALAETELEPPSGSLTVPLQ
jgi:hypothetical protein